MASPIVLIIFNRPEHTQTVFNQIRKIRPKTLLIVADGSRNKEELDRCQQARAITEQIDWDCQVFRNYSDVNLGCRLRVSSGLDWAFERVEEAIILEDDCFPSLNFIEFCTELLCKYRKDCNVMHIGGNSILPDRLKGSSHSYTFTKYAGIWGWATWQRAWEKFDINMIGWPHFQQSKEFKKTCSTKIEREYWIPLFDKSYSQLTSAWSYAWMYTIWKSQGLCISPTQNLVANIGFGQDATHTKNLISPFPLSSICETSKFELKHPKSLKINKRVDNFILKNWHLRYIKKHSLIERIKEKLQVPKI